MSVMTPQEIAAERAARLAEIRALPQRDDDGMWIDYCEDCLTPQDEDEIHDGYSSCCNEPTHNQDVLLKMAQAE